MGHLPDLPLWFLVLVVSWLVFLIVFGSWLGRRQRRRDVSYAVTLGMPEAEARRFTAQLAWLRERRHGRRLLAQVADRIRMDTSGGDDLALARELQQEFDRFNVPTPWWAQS